MNVNWKKIQSVILSVTCLSLINFPELIHIPSYAFVNFWNPTSYYFLSLSHSLKVECELEKNSLNIFICHLSFLKKLSPTHKHSLHMHSWIFEALQVIFFEFESFEKKGLNENWKKIPSIILSVTCNSLWNFPPLIHIPHIHSLIYSKPFKLLFHVFESFIKGQMWIGKKFTQ